MAHPTLAILGAGQLGRMLGLAAARLGVRCRFLDPAGASPEGCPAGVVGEVIAASFDDRGALDRLADGADAITYEFENVPAETVEYLAARARVDPPPPALRTAQDRVLEKQLFAACGVPTNASAPWDSSVQNETDLLRLLDTIGYPAVLKTRRLGYDGKGQAIVRDWADVPRAVASLPRVPLLAEAHVAFERELSIIAARARSGEVRAYPLVQNTHREGILRTTIAPAPNLPASLQAEARASIGTLMERLNYVGVMALELFETGGALLANEIAPRVHNTGHWTIEGARTSQFENHVRAVLGWPLGDTSPVGCSAMVNLIGTDPDPAHILAIPGAAYHWYAKAVKPGRKVGHVTLRGDDPGTVASRADQVARLCAS